MGDPLNYLLELGFTLDEVETLKSRHDFTCQQMADAAKAIVDRGGNPLEAFGPRATGWEKPIPFDEIQTPDFPVEALPGPLGAFVECLAESTQTPEEMGGTVSLGVLATAFQRRYEVEVTRDWREPLCLYSSAVAPPGERKSAVISALNKPIYEYEAEVRAAEAAEIAQNQTERALLEKALEAIAKIDIMTENGIIVCESAAESALPELAAPYAKGRDYRYGKIKITLYHRAV